MSPMRRKTSRVARGPRSRLAELLDTLAVREGLHPTDVPGVQLARISEGAPRKPILYEPMIVVLGQGRKRVYVGGEVIRYDAGNYLALSVPVPVECEVDASAREPLLAVRIAIEPALLAEILVTLDEPVRESEVPRGIDASPLTPEISDAVVRLLECLRRPADSRILGPQTVREIVYRVLQHESGGGAAAALRALATRNDRFMRIARVLQQVHADPSVSLSIEDLARSASMSASTFHHNFKAVTATSPLQYLKSLRLHRARLLMVNAGHNASTAALAVGYESASQFGREFKRFFGKPPVEEAAELRARLAAGAADLRPVGA
jgi:AraC-like DNA-binding protein